MHSAVQCWGWGGTMCISITAVAYVFLCDFIIVLLSIAHCVFYCVYSTTTVLLLQHKKQ